MFHIEIITPHPSKFSPSPSPSYMDPPVAIMVLLKLLLTVSPNSAQSQPYLALILVRSGVPPNHLMCFLGNCRKLISPGPCPAMFTLPIYPSRIQQSGFESTYCACMWVDSTQIASVHMQPGTGSEQNYPD